MDVTIEGWRETCDNCGEVKEYADPNRERAEYIRQTISTHAMETQYFRREVMAWRCVASLIVGDEAETLSAEECHARVSAFLTTAQKHRRVTEAVGSICDEMLADTFDAERAVQLAHKLADAMANLGGDRG